MEPKKKKKKKRRRKDTKIKTDTERLSERFSANTEVNYGSLMGRPNTL